MSYVSYPYQDASVQRSGWIKRVSFYLYIPGFPGAQESERDYYTRAKIRDVSGENKGIIKSTLSNIQNKGLTNNSKSKKSK